MKNARCWFYYQKASGTGQLAYRVAFNFTSYVFFLFLFCFFFAVFDLF